MKTARMLAAFLVAGILPTFAHAQSFYPYYSAGVSRAEFVQMTLSDIGGFRQDGTHCFVDVTNQPYAPEVCAAKLRGIVTGRPDGRFLPDQPIAFIEAAAIVVRAKNVSVSAGQVWYSPYIQKLASWDAIPDSVYNILDPLTRAQAQELLDAALDGEDDDEDEDDDESDEMKLTVTASDSTAEEGDRVTFRIKIENKDNDDIEVDVNAELDDGMDFISADNGGDDSDTGSGDDDEVEWEDIEIDEDDTETLLLTVRLNSRADDGDTLKLKVEVEDIRVTKTIKVDEDDDDDDNDDDEDLNLTVTDSIDPVMENGTVTYYIRLENEGNDDIRADVLAELDDGMDFVSASDGGDEDDDEIEWKNVRVDEDTTKTVMLTVRLNGKADDGDKLRLRVEANEEEDVETTDVDDDGYDDDEDDDDVTISITDSDDPVEEGDRITYRISIENKEDDDITIDVRAKLDDLTSFIDASGNGEEDGDDEIIWEDVTIKEDATKVLTLEVRVTSKADDGDTLKLEVEAGDDEGTETTKVKN